MCMHSMDLKISALHGSKRMHKSSRIASSVDVKWVYEQYNEAIKYVSRWKKNNSWSGI